MKVLVYTSLFPNHLEPDKGIFIKQRMFHFAKLDGCEIKVVAPVPYIPPWGWLGKRSLYSRIRPYEIMEGIEVYHPRYPLIPKVGMAAHGFLMFLASRRLLRRIYAHFPFELIDAHYIYPDGFAAALLAASMQKPLVLSARGSDINQFAAFKSIRPMIKFALMHADCAVSVCESLKTEMVSLGIDGNRITVVPNGVDTERFYPVEKAMARQKLSIPQGVRVIVSVGALIPRKAFHLVLNSLPDLLGSIPDLHFFIIGEGPERSSLEQQIRRMNLRGNVTLLGNRPNEALRDWYNAADVFCLASSREGWPNVLMEALACGTPVVATKVYGAPEIITTPAVGVLVDQTSVSIGKGLRAALETIWDRDHIAAHAGSRDWSKVAHEVKHVFASVMEV